MALEQYPIQNSEVYVLSPHPQNHPSQVAPPTPPTQCENRSMTPIPDVEMPITPPLGESYPESDRRLSVAVHVLGTEATALSCLTRLYEVDPIARGGFDRAVEAITRCMGKRGKIVICGVGKSGHIAKKLVATMNSLRISATFLHPTEALHGDLGKVGEDDVILLITFSGRTPELLSLLPHFSERLPLLIITAHTHPSTCTIVSHRADAILLPAPIHEAESLSFGVSAPTTSTTIALALGDALAVAVSTEIHPSVAEVFSRNHPGGAIGQAAKAPQRIGDIAISLSNIPFVNEGRKSSAKASHVIVTGYQSPSGWVRYGNDGIIPRRRLRCLQPDDMNLPATKVNGLVVSKRDWITIPGDAKVDDVITWVKSARQSVRTGNDGYHDDTILAVVEDGTITGVLDLETLLASQP